MMRHFKYIAATLAFVLFVWPSAEAKTWIARKNDIQRLLADVRNDSIQVGRTRLSDIRNRYGDAATITDSERSVSYDYGDIKIEFDKKKYMTAWGYDYFKSAAYSESIDTLREDLEGGEIVGSYIEARDITKDYGEPTQIEGSERDGEKCYYFYGNIKLTFENYIIVKKFKVESLPEEQRAPGVLGSVPPEKKP